MCKVVAPVGERHDNCSIARSVGVPIHIWVMRVGKTRQGAGTNTTALESIANMVA